MTVVESDTVSAEIIALFDHDYQYHVLVMEQRRSSTLDPFEIETYALLFVGLDVVTIVCSWSFEDHSYSSVLMESAQIVAEWRALMEQGS